MKPLYTKILTLNNDGEALTKSFKSSINKWAEENKIEQYNPIELSFFLKEELDVIICYYYCHVAEGLQTDSEARASWIMDELANAVKLVLDDNNTPNGLHWPDVIERCKSAYEKKLKLDKGDY